MSPWRSTGLIHAALLLACTKPNPAFDPDASVSASEGDSASDSAGPASDSVATASASVTNTSASTDTGGSVGATESAATTADPTSVSTSGTTDDLTTAPGCGGLGESCGASDCCQGCGLCMAGTCVADDGACGPCESCGVGSACAPKPPGTPCELAEDPCAGKTWGLDDGTCYANAPADGACDPGGACKAPPNCDQGAPIVTCDVVCIIDPANCASNVPVAQVNADLLCAQDGPTPQCDAACVDHAPDDNITVRSCQQGLCQIVKSTSCGAYVCKTPDACPNNCMSEDDCKPPHQCDNNECE